ncbi:hypothetical protein F5Y15DRAFT_101085 [Xylariaceae sp. FL0016]|nr:hypothetical protein F5Y15DRAFT_101085 [Xylariaceae sp. FL0016]
MRMTGQHVRGIGSRVSAIFEGLPSKPLPPLDVDNWLRIAGNRWVDVYPNTGIKLFAEFVTECAHKSGLKSSRDDIHAMISLVMSADSYSFPSTDGRIYTLGDIGSLFKGRRIFYWSDSDQSLRNFGVGPNHLQTGDTMIAAKRPSANDYEYRTTRLHQFQVVPFIRTELNGSSRLVGDGLLVLSLSSANFWFPSSTAEVMLN